MVPEPLLRSVRRVALRVRAQHAIDGAATLALAGLGVAALALLGAKIDLFNEPDARALLVVAVASPILGAIAGALRPVSSLAAARMLDRAHGTRGRIAAALELATAGIPDPWTDTAIADAVEHAATLRPSRAMPLRAPRDLAPALGLAVAVGLLGSLEIPRRIVTPIARGITPLLLHEDDLDAYDQRLRDVLEAGDLAPEVRAEADALNRVLEDLADHRIDRDETMRRLAEIEARIAARPPSDASLVRDELRAMGHELARSDLADDLAEAMNEGDAATAELEMRELAERLRTEPPSPREAERLREALAEAAREAEREAGDEASEHEEETERLLERRREQGATEEEQERLLEQRRRELDQLRRDQQEQQEARRRLDRLRREMNEAAQDLEQQQESGAEQASRDLDEGAEDLQRMARQQMSEEQMQELARQLQELRELARRQREQQAGEGGRAEGEGNEDGQTPSERGGQSPSRMDRFVLRARGEGDGEGMPIGAPGGGGAGEPGAGTTPGSGEGSGGEQAPRAGGGGTGGTEPGEGEGQGGPEGGDAQEEMLMLGQGGDARLEIPGLGGGGAGDDERGAGGEGDPEGSAGGAGDEHDPATLEDPTGRTGAQRTVQVRGDAERGPSRSEVIHSASQSGFAGRGYRDVYSEYAGHAEEVIERDRVPPGYRFYVRRYFQLIRPRDGSSPREE